MPTGVGVQVSSLAPTENPVIPTVTGFLLSQKRGIYQLNLSTDKDFLFLGAGCQANRLEPCPYAYPPDVASCLLKFFKSSSNVDTLIQNLEFILAHGKPCLIRHLSVNSPMAESGFCSFMY